MMNLIGKTIKRVTFEDYNSNMILYFTDNTILALSADMVNGNPYIEQTELMPQEVKEEMT